MMKVLLVLLALSGSRGLTSSSAKGIKSGSELDPFLLPELSEEERKELLDYEEEDGDQGMNS